MTRTTRIWLPVVLAIAAATVLALPVAARSPEPVRSGTIVGGVAPIAPNRWLVGRATDGCHSAPDCLAWVQSGCSPALARRDTAATTSIVGVAGLRGTSRVFEYDRASPAGLAWGGVELQFWRRDCTEIHGSGWAAWDCWDEFGHCDWPTLRVPSRAKWMTVTGSQDTLNIRWTLT